MNKISYTILRVGLGITFLWVGVLIFQSPEGWSNFISPWAAELIPFSLKNTMICVAIFDVLIGALLIYDFIVWIGALLAAIHMIDVLIVSGITNVTVRNIAILAGALAVFIESMPPTVVNRLKSLFKINHPSAPEKS